MKESEWLAETDDPYRMLNFLRKRVSSRKAKLFACACFRLRRPRLKKWEQKIVDVAERHADGLASEAELKQAEEDSVGRSAVAWVTLTKDYWTAVEAARAAGEWRDEAIQCSLVRDLFGNPFRAPALNPAWHNSSVRGVAQAIYDERRFGDLPVLADALEEAGCTEAKILAHCRGPGPHARGCWVLDLILGKS